MFQNHAFGGSAFGNNGGAAQFGNKDGGAFSSGFGTVNPTNTAFGASNSGFSSNSYSGNSQPVTHNQVATFDSSGNMINNTNSRGGGRGRGNNNNFRGGGRGGTGGNRGSANKTYIAPGLSGQQYQSHTQQHQSHTQQHQQQYSTAPLHGVDNGSGYTSPAGAGRGHGGYNTRGRGGRGGAFAGGIPGQYKSLQWRPDNTQHQQAHQSTSQPMDSVVSTTNAPIRTSMQSGFKSAVGLNGPPQQHQQQHFPASVQGNQNTGMQFGTAVAAGSRVAIGEEQGRWQSYSMDTVNSTFGGESSMSAFPPAHQASTTSTAFGKQNSVFAAPTAYETKSSGNSQSGTPLAFTTPSKSLPTMKDAPGAQLPNIEDADSRLARFTAVPIGNRYEELKENRAKEREKAIKQGAIADPNHRRRLEHAITLIGTCMDMCPEYERHEREYQQSLEKFEKIPGTESVDHSRAVKAYSRPAAGVDQPLPSDVRPPRVLLMTLDYLITEIVGQGDLADSHAFVRDRTRSIRQDFTLQNSRGIEAVKAHEIIARYHILCIHQLCENKNFSLQQELEQLWNVLTSLQEFYDDLRTEGVDCPNEAEFRAYNILCHLYDPDMIRQAQSLPQHILQNPYIQVAVEVHALTRRNNNVRRRAKIQSEASPNYFSRFFKLIEGPKITYLMACLLETDFGGIRKGALKALNKSYLEQHEGFPVEDLIRILGFDNAEECILNCQEYDLEISHHGQPAVVFGKKEPSSRRRIFKEGTITISQHRNERIVEAKRRNFTTVQIIRGETPQPQLSQMAITPSFSSVPSTDRSKLLGVRGSHGLASTNVVSQPTPVASMAVGATAFPTTSHSQPPMFDFGLHKPSASASTRTPANPLLASRSAMSADLVSSTQQVPSSLPPIKPPTHGNMSTSSSLNPTAPVFKPMEPTGFTFSAPLPRDRASDASTVANPPTITFKVPQTATPAFQGALTGSTQLPPPTKPSSPLTSSSSSGSRLSAIPRPIVLPSTPFMLSSSSSLPSPAAPPTPRSDATRIVTKRGRVYPRTIVESVMMDILERETSRLIRSTAAQMLQEVMLERSVRRAEERQEMIRRESMSIMSILVAQFTDQVVAEIVVDLHRETCLQRKVIARWKDYTVKCRQRAEELRRRQEHFLTNVRAMNSYAGLKDGHLVAQGIREYREQQRINRTHTSVGVSRFGSARDSGGLKAMVAAVSNKRKRLLSIGQEGSPDMALVAGLKKVAEPKRELWAPLPVLDIVQNSYSRKEGRPLQSQQKRRWRLFIGTFTFKDTNSKWLLTKLGVDVSRHTKSQQWFGTMVAVLQNLTMEQSPTEVVVHGAEDQSMKELLGIPRYTVMETAAFIFEFSKIPFADHDVSDEAIRLYWIGERDRLVRFLACFPKVKQPIVFIMWSNRPEVWERVSPHMVEYLELDRLVDSPDGRLLGYRFLNLDMTSMKLDPYIVGALEWLASETKDVVENPEAMLMDLLDRYRPIYDWSLCRISLSGGPLYSQYDDDEEGEIRLWRMKVSQRRSSSAVGGSRGLTNDQSQDQVRNMFVDITESGFNLAVRLFNLQLENLAQAIEDKGQDGTREGAEQEGKVKEAMASFIRQAELPEIKRGAIQDRLNFGMDPKSAFCDMVDVYIATLGGLAKEQQNWETKAAMRTTIWQMLTLSNEDRVPLEAVFKHISSQILKWIAAGILNTERFSVRIHTRKWDQAQFSPQDQQHPIQRREAMQEDEDMEQREPVKRVDSSEQSFAPLMIHDDVDVEGYMFDYENAVQSEVQAWERSVERQIQDREDHVLAIANENTQTKLAALTPLKIGDGRKRHAPGSPGDDARLSYYGPPVRISTHSLQIGERIMSARDD